MSVIIKDMDGNIKILSKGADTVLSKYLRELDPTKKQDMGQDEVRRTTSQALLKHAKDGGGKAEETREGEDDFAAMLLNLFVTASLMLLKKIGASRSSAAGMPIRFVLKI